MRISGAVSCARYAASCGLCAANVWACWDWPFKGGTDDLRESPALLLVQELLREGCHICVHDPAAMERAREVLPPAVEFVGGAYDAARGADALLILTDWEQFAALDLIRLRKLLKYPIVIDGRNLYHPATMATHGFSYYSVGRAAIVTETRRRFAPT